MSVAHTPTLPLVLPLYVSLEQHLIKTKNDMTLPRTIRSATGDALAKLRKYKNLAFNNQFYTVATSKSYDLILYSIRIPGRLTSIESMSSPKS